MLAQLKSKGLWPQYRLLSTVFKEDPQGLQAFEHEWMLQKKWLIATGWSVMTLLLVFLGGLLDTGFLVIPGRQQELGLITYLLMVLVAIAFAGGGMLVASVLNKRFSQPASERQIEWASRVIGDNQDIPRGVTKGDLVRMVGESL